MDYTDELLRITRDWNTSKNVSSLETGLSNVLRDISQAKPARHPINDLIVDVLDNWIKNGAPRTASKLEVISRTPCKVSDIDQAIIKRSPHSNCTVNVLIRLVFATEDFSGITAFFEENIDGVLSGIILLSDQEGTQNIKVFEQILNAARDRKIGVRNLLVILFERLMKKPQTEPSLLIVRRILLELEPNKTFDHIIIRDSSWKLEDMFSEAPLDVILKYFTDEFRYRNEYYLTIELAQILAASYKKN